MLKRLQHIPSGNIWRECAFYLRWWREWRWLINDVQRPTKWGVTIWENLRLHQEKIQQDQLTEAHLHLSTTSGWEETQDQGPFRDSTVGFRNYRPHRERTPWQYLDLGPAHSTRRESTEGQLASRDERKWRQQLDHKGAQLSGPHWRQLQPIIGC